MQKTSRGNLGINTFLRNLIKRIKNAKDIPSSKSRSLVGSRMKNMNANKQKANAIQE